MKRRRLYRLSHAERAERNRQLKDTMKYGLIRPDHSEFGLPILVVRKADGSIRMCREMRSDLQPYQQTRPADV
jgi:hypothetical protein